MIDASNVNLGLFKTKTKPKLAEVLTATANHAALAIDRGNLLGSLEVGKKLIG